MAQAVKISSWSSRTLIGLVIAFTSPGSEHSIDHYTIYYSTDGATGEQLQELTSVPVLCVKAFGKPSLANHMSAGVPRHTN